MDQVNSVFRTNNPWWREQEADTRLERQYRALRESGVSAKDAAAQLEAQLPQDYDGQHYWPGSWELAPVSQETYRAKNPKAYGSHYENKYQQFKAAIEKPLDIDFTQSRVYIPWAHPMQAEWNRLNYEASKNAGSGGGSGGGIPSTIQIEGDARSNWSTQDWANYANQPENRGKNVNELKTEYANQIGANPSQYIDVSKYNAGDMSARELAGRQQEWRNDLISDQAKLSNQIFEGTGKLYSVDTLTNLGINRSTYNEAKKLGVVDNKGNVAVEGGTIYGTYYTLPELNNLVKQYGQISLQGLIKEDLSQRAYQAGRQFNALGGIDTTVSRSQAESGANLILGNVFTASPDSYITGQIASPTVNQISVGRTGISNLPTDKVA